MHKQLQQLKQRQQLKHLQTKCWWTALLLAALAVAPWPVSLGAAPGTGPAAGDDQAVENVRPSLVSVEYTLKYDGSEAPRGGGFAERCPNCGRFHGSGVSDLVEQERPAEAAGFVVADDLVLAQDPLLHERFVAAVAVRHGETLLPARIVHYYTDRNAVLLQTDQPMPGVKPLRFEPDAAGPYRAVSYTRGDGVWKIGVASSGSAAYTPWGKRMTPSESLAVITAADGTPVGIGTGDALPADEPWKGTPMKWPALTGAQLDARLKELRARADQVLLRVQLSLRSPRAKAESAMSFGRFGRDEDENATERNAVGVLVADRTVLVLCELDPSTTARLERITIHRKDGESVPAKFDCSLKDHGALVVSLDSPLPQPATFAPVEQEKLTRCFLLSAEVQVKGEDRVEHFGRGRIASFEPGWRRQLVPEMAGDDTAAFLFDEQLRLVGLPIARRTTKSENRWSSETVKIAMAAYLAPVVANPRSFGDPSNVPLSEDEENRLAWLGVELQALTPDLARMQSLTQQTEDGEKGALVTHVYPGSPAERIGIKPGAVLLRLHTPDQPAPLDITADHYAFAESAFPWNRFDELPEAYFDRIPQPWPTAETTLARTLTDLGFGKTIEVELAMDGKVSRLSLTITQSPPHFDASPKLKHDGLGVTVRPMTYEVRRYFQLKDEEPGMILATIEPGSRASRAGLKPFEYITHVNDTPVRTVADFEKATADQKEVRLSVKRYNTGRVVKLTLPAEAPATAPATQRSNP